MRRTATLHRLRRRLRHARGRGRRIHVATRWHGACAPPGREASRRATWRGQLPRSGDAATFLFRDRPHATGRTGTARLWHC